MKRVVAQIGIISRGVIFILMSVLTALTVYKGGRGKVSGTAEAFEYISGTFYGIILLIAIVIGMIIYVFWRVYLTWNVSKSKSRRERLRLQANHLGIAVVYLSFVVYALKLILPVDWGSGDFFTEIINDYGGKLWFEIIVALCGLAVIGKGVFQFYLAFTRKFLILVVDDIPAKAKKYYTIFGTIGYTVRGIIFSCLGFLIFRSAYQLHGNPSKSPADALVFLKFLLGNTFLLVLAIGLFIFSLFVFIKAKYRKVENP